MHGKENRGIGVRANATSAGGEFMSQDPAAVADCAVPDGSVVSYENSRCCTFPRKLACSHAISHALKAFDSPFSLTVPLSVRALSVSIFFIPPIFAKCMGRRTAESGFSFASANIEFSQYENSRLLHLPAKMGFAKCMGRKKHAESGFSFAFAN